MLMRLNHNKKPRSLRSAFLANASIACAAVVASTGLPVATLADSTVDLTPFQVIGSKENLHFTPGSGYYIDDNEIVLHNYDNIEQVMRRVPGVYFRTEDGFGIFPNISFRGVGSMRTTKLTVMEDGVLSAPAPYSNPAAYYTPTSGRMSGVEILKGSSQIQYGPQTTGGILNYLSTPLPNDSAGRIRASFGSNNDLRFHSYYGDRFTTELGEFAILLELYYRQNDGFKSIDRSSTYAGGDTGFRKSEPMLKLAWTPNTRVNQQFELKVGYSDMTAEETYLGVSSDDFADDPYRRYVASQFDTIPTEHWRTYLRHSIDFGSQNRLATTLYYNQFARSWYKLHDVRSLSGGATSLAEALAGSPFYSGGDPVPGTAGEPLRVLRGEAAGIWRVRNNNREYKSYGVESVIQHRTDGGEVSHSLEIGLRLHEDYEDRFQQQDDYEADANGNVVGVTMRQPGTQDNRRGAARALALYARDDISWNQWTVSPGFRYERVRYTDQRRGMNPAATDFNQVIRETKGTLDIFAPGISALYDIHANWVAFASLHKGFSLPNPGAATSTSNPIGAETSIGSEVGVRFRDNQGLRAELVLFHTDFRDLIVPDNIGGAGTGQTENAGDVRSYGLEAAVSYDPGRANGWDVNTPFQVAFTWTDATIRSDVSASGTSGGAVESIFAGGEKGNRLPYIARYQISAGAGVEWARFGVYLDTFYIPSTYASANNSEAEINPVGGANGTPIADARFGKNDAYFLVDLSARYQVNDQLALTLSAQNLLDRTYMASRLPHGPRPGHPRFVSVGMVLDF